MESFCSICSEQFDDIRAIAAIHCGHTFHDTCLTTWLLNKKSCPHCRISVRANMVIHKLFFDKADDTVGLQNGSRLIANEFSDLSVKVTLLQKERDEMKSKLDSNTKTLESLSKKFIQKTERLRDVESERTALRTCVSDVYKQLDMYSKEKEEMSKMRERFSNMKLIEDILNKTEGEIKQLMEQFNDRHLAVYCTTIKHEYEKTKSEKKSLESQLRQKERDMIYIQQELVDSKQSSEQSKAQLSYIEQDLKSLSHDHELLKRKHLKLRQFLQKHKHSYSSFRPGNPGAFVSHLSEKENLTENMVSMQKINPSTSSSLSIDSPSLFMNDSDVINSEDSFADSAATEIVKTPSFPLSNKSIKDQLHKQLFEPNDNSCRISEQTYIIGSTLNPCATHTSFKNRSKNNLNSRVCDTKNSLTTNKMKKKLCTNDSSSNPIYDFNIFKNVKGKLADCDYNSKVRSNYNGLGGHTTFIERSRLKTIDNKSKQQIPLKEFCNR